MILNISGRCDVVAFYTPWLLNRIKEGYIDVRNPFYEKQVSRIYLKDVDAYLFCTKNPIPILPYLKELKKQILFHVTVTPYGKEIEPNVPPKGKIVQSIQKLSKILGKENIYVRYDPIFLSNKYSLERHMQNFTSLCQHLDGYVEHIIISFLDSYKNVLENQKIIQEKKMTNSDYETLGKSFFKIAKEHHMTIQTCYENNFLTQYGFQEDVCLSRSLAYKLTGKKNWKKWQARKCGCVEMVDIGCYNTCSHFCKYCYANYDEKKVENNQKNHDPLSSLLIGHLEKEDIVKVRK